jgi:hypothetical protein
MPLPVEKRKYIPSEALWITAGSWDQHEPEQAPGAPYALTDTPNRVGSKRKRLLNILNILTVVRNACKIE